MRRKRKQTDIGEIVAWGLGAFALFKMLGNNTQVVGQTLAQNAKRYWHTKLPSDLNSKECKTYKIDMKSELLSFNIPKERLHASATFEGRLIYSDYKNVYKSNVFQFRIK